MIWRLRHVPEHVFVWALSVVVGLCSGIAAALLKTAVHAVNQFLLQFGFSTSLSGNGMMLIYPALGILLTMLFVKYVVHGHIGHGLPSVLLAISRKQGFLPPRNMWTSLVASTITVAFGGSVGLEAPIASTGSAIGSNIGRFFRVTNHNVKLLLGCGAAGAIAGIFNAPIAGVFFVVEVFMFDLSRTSAISLLISSISASSTAFFLMGSDVRFAFTVTEPFILSQTPYYIILGVFCAFTSIYFLRTMDKVEGWFALIKHPAHRMIVSGILLGLLIFFFPPLFGEGYYFLSDLLHGRSDTLFQHSVFQSYVETPWIFLLLVFLLILFKVVATAATIGGGGVGGTFGPSLVVGGLSGYLVASLCNMIGMPPQSAANFALVGMAAVMTGVMQAPFMAVLLIAEITGGYALMIPLLVASAVTFVCVSPFERHSIYARKLALQGDLLTHDKDQSAWQLIDMRKLIETNFICVYEGDKLRDLVEAIKDSKRNIFPVISDDEKFVGVIYLDTVRKVIFQPELYDHFEIDQFIYRVEENEIIRLSAPPQQVVERFRNSDRYNLIVLDDDDTYVGFLSRANVFSAYRRFVCEVSEE